MAFSPDGRTLAAAGKGDGAVWLWNLPSNVLAGPAEGVVSVALSPGGRTLAAGNIDGTVWLWNVTDPARPARLSTLSTGPPAAAFSVAFSPGGRTLAAGTRASTVWLWNVTDPARPARLGQPLRRPHGRCSRCGQTASSLLSGVQPGRADPGRRQRRRHGLAVERDRPGPSRPAQHAVDRPHRHYLLGGVQPGRPDPGHRRH